MAIALWPRLNSNSRAGVMRIGRVSGVVWGYSTLSTPILVMTTLLKDRYNADYIQRLADAIGRVRATFDRNGYVRTVLGSGWDTLELKQRMRRISSTLHPFLPLPYPGQIEVLEEAVPGFGGFEGMLFPDFVEQFGLGDFAVSVRALERFTQHSSSEFAVRPFILRHGKRMMATMLAWSTHRNEHVRRLSSEGCRPRLPWAVALPEFKKDPSPILPILENLRADPSEYVRRSVANNLNDIAKDHPELLLETAGRWLGTGKATDALVKHACRTLLKRGDSRALRLFGFRQGVEVSIRGLGTTPQRLAIGGSVRFEFDVVSGTSSPLRLEYAIDFVKARGQTSRKVFQITERTFPKGTPTRLSKKHRFTDFTTRTHHPGAHTLTVLVNGEDAASIVIDLLPGRPSGAAT